MFVGHYGPSLALRRASGGVPLWVLFLAVQFVDVLWALFVIFGVEKVRITPGFTESSPLDLYYMPYTHSLAASIGWALLLGWLASFVWSRRGGFVVGACVLSHWFLDLPAHVADLPLWGDVYKVGFGLWNSPPTNLFMPPPAEPYQFALMALTLYVALAAAAAFVEKKCGYAILGMNDASP